MDTVAKIRIKFVLNENEKSFEVMFEREAYFEELPRIGETVNLKLLKNDVFAHSYRVQNLIHRLNSAGYMCFEVIVVFEEVEGSSADLMTKFSERSILEFCKAAEIEGWTSRCDEK